MSSRFLQSISSACRLRGYSYKTEKTYIHWIRRFILFTGKRHPRDCGDVEVIAFLSDLAENRRVSVNTQKVALNALVFLYRHTVQNELGELGFKLATKKRQLPTVLSRHEVSQIIEALSGRDKLVFQLLYGSGLRISECLRLRVKDINLENASVTVVDGKGRKDRQTILAVSLIAAL